jgi:hypothetical protein
MSLKSFDLQPVTWDLLSQVKWLLTLVVFLILLVQLSLLS